MARGALLRGSDRFKAVTTISSKAAEPEFPAAVESAAA
jgi:hypothetical protein